MFKKKFKKNLKKLLLLKDLKKLRIIIKNFGVNGEWHVGKKLRQAQKRERHKYSDTKIKSYEITMLFCNLKLNYNSILM